MINKRNIVESLTPPSSIRDLWLYKGNLLYFGTNGWESVEAQLDDDTEKFIQDTVDEINQTIEDTKEEITEELNKFKEETQQKLDDINEDIQDNIKDMYTFDGSNGSTILEYLNNYYPDNGTYSLNRFYFKNADGTQLQITEGTKTDDGWVFKIPGVNQLAENGKQNYGIYIQVDNDGTVTPFSNMLVYAADKFLADDQGTLKTSISITYDDEVLEDGSKKGTINLRGLNNQIVSSIDATNFLIDGMLINVEYQGSEDPEDESEGKLVFTWNLDGSTGSTQKVVEVPIGDLFSDAKAYTDSKIAELNTDVTAAIEAEATARQEADTQLQNNLDEAVENMENQAEDNLLFSSDLNPDLQTLQDHGGIKAGTKISDLVGKSWKYMFEEILWPTIQPTATNPSATISFKSIPTIQEVGVTGSTVPTADSFNKTFNRGQIQILGKAEQANPERAGALDENNSFIYINGSASNTTFPTVIPDGNITYRWRAAYLEGNQPLDSKGNPATSITTLPAGYVDSNTLTINGVYPYFANNTNNSSETKLSLTTATTINVVFVAEGPNKHYFKLPAKYTLTQVQMLNTLSGKYENFGTNRWDVTTENVTVQGNEVSYKRYTRNDSGFNGESDFKITFTKA